MTRTLVTTLLLALLAAPMALAQHGPPPGYTDPNEYAADYVAQQADAASADPAGYAQGVDPAAEAEHALWLACWEAYSAADHALDAACAGFFSAPVTVDADVKAVEANITQVLNDTGVSDLAAEALDIVNDTVADPKTALDQVERAIDAVIRFVEGLLELVVDTLGLGALALAAGLLGGILGIADLAAMPFEGLDLAGQGLADIGLALASILGLVGSGLATASSAVGDAALDGVSALVDAAQDAATAAVDGLVAAITGLGDGIQATAGAIGDGAQALASGVADTAEAVRDGVADAADAVRDGVSDALDKVGSLFDGKSKESSSDRARLPGAPKTGTGVDGLLDDVLDSV